MTGTLALFDLDSTLLDGDSELVWCYYLLQHGIVDTPFMKQIEQYCYGYEAGNLDYVEFERYLLSPVAAFSSTQVRQMIDEYLQQINGMFRGLMLKRLESHREQGHDLILASAANSFLIQPIARLLKIPNLVCTRAEIINDVPTGEVIGKPAFREGKVESLKNWLSENKASLAGSWMYSDSHNDLPILSLVEHPVAVGPDKLLRQAALENGWQIIEKSEFAQVKKNLN